MKGEITLKVLEKIAGVGADMGELFDVFLSMPYGTSYGRLQHALNQRRRQRNGWEQQMERARQQYHELLYRLKRDGLIVSREKASGKRWFFLTPRGRRKLQTLKVYCQPKLPKARYAAEQSNTFVLVVFDVPEREKRKRNWLRASLRSMGLSMLQKSVWIGKVKVPVEFIEDLKRLNIVDCVEVLAITKTGSLRHLT